MQALWTDSHPTNIISQWRDEWKSAPVVNSSLVDDPAIRQSGFDLNRRHWATKANAHHVKRSGALQQPTRALVANAKLRHILSTAVHSPSMRGAAAIALS